MRYIFAFIAGLSVAYVLTSPTADSYALVYVDADGAGWIRDTGLSADDCRAYLARTTICELEI